MQHPHIVIDRPNGAAAGKVLAAVALLVAPSRCTGCCSAGMPGLMVATGRRFAIAGPALLAVVGVVGLIFDVGGVGVRRSRPR